MQDVDCERQGHLGIMTLSRPQALNSLTLDMILTLQKQLREWEADDAVHALVIQSAPGKAFCAGGDVRFLYESGLKGDPLQMEFFWHEYRLNHFIHQLKKPYIALMDGLTMGGGVGISLHGSFPVASENFVFAMPETGIGLFPDVGASYLLSRCPGQLGLYLGLTGERLDASQALLAGLVKNLIKREHFPEVFSRLKSLDLSRDAFFKVGQCLDGLSETPKNSLEHLTQINQYFAYPTLQTIFQRLQSSDEEWALNCLKSLEKKSPLSLEVTFTQIQQAKTLSLEQCLKMDYDLVNHFMRDNDFYEGVRALLIDKDKTPQWIPPQLSAVKTADIVKYFEGVKPELTL